jgi:hypothetical protein
LAGPYSEQPDAKQFETGMALVKYAHAIEALREIYSRLQEPNPPATRTLAALDLFREELIGQ